MFDNQERLVLKVFYHEKMIEGNGDLTQVWVLLILKGCILSCCTPLLYFKGCHFFLAVRGELVKIFFPQSRNIPNCV